MPPIPLHKDAPIAQKPTGITPQTLDSNNSNNNQQAPPPTRTTPFPIPATTTSDPFSPSDPPPPQPGARPLPPTNTANPNPNPPPPTNAYNPIPPQPGPIPGGPTATATATATATHITTETRLAENPPQFNIPPPSDSQLAGRSTTTATNTGGNKPGPTTLNLGPVASPFQSQGGQGNGEGIGATQTGSEPDSGQRRSLEHPPGYVQAKNDGSYAGGMGLGAGGGQQQEQNEGGVGGAAWNLLAKAGEALQKGEEAAWRAVRK